MWPARSPLVRTQPLPRRRVEEPGAARGSTSPPPPPEARPPQAPITWKSALLALGACGVVLAYFEFEKAKRKRTQAWL